MENLNKPVPTKSNLPPTIRRIVCGHDSSGTPCVQKDSEMSFNKTSFWGSEAARIWKTTEMPSKDNNLPADFDGAQRTLDRMRGLTGSNSSHLMISDLAPGGYIPMHRTSTIDYIIMSLGSVTLVEESGEEVVLKAGDIVVQKGGMHAWKNHSEEWARWVCVILDAEPARGANGTPLAEEWKE